MQIQDKPRASRSFADIKARAEAPLVGRKHSFDEWQTAVADRAELVALVEELRLVLLGVRTDILRTDFDTEFDRCLYMTEYLEEALAKVQS